VGVGYEDMIDLQKLSRRKDMQVSEMKEKSLPPELEFHVDARVTVWIIDQVSIEQEMFLASVSPFPFFEMMPSGYLSFYLHAGNTKILRSF
jgi:hypothetical protein